MLAFVNGLNVNGLTEEPTQLEQELNDYRQ